jgi:DNA-binding transcriptional MerR regulator
MERIRGGRLQPQAIPNKLYFRIGEVSDLVGVKPYVLRYWESEFPDIKPSKSKSGQRLYKRRDVELLLRIRELLYEERFTINGARKRLKDFSRGDEREAEPEEVALELVEEVGPRQLDVFEVDVEPGMAAESEDRRRGDVERGARDPAPRENVKTLQKIRRDLEELLAMIRA